MLLFCRRRRRDQQIYFLFFLLSSPNFCRKLSVPSLAVQNLVNRRGKLSCYLSLLENFLLLASFLSTTTVTAHFPRFFFPNRPWCPCSPHPRRTSPQSPSPWTLQTMPRIRRSPHLHHPCRRCGPRPSCPLGRWTRWPLLYSLCNQYPCSKTLWITPFT